MYADLGPGQTIDLDAPSPDGVDLLYSHAHVATRFRGATGRSPELDERMNLYKYVMNNPVNYVDPSGLRTCGFAGELCLDESCRWRAFWYKPEDGEWDILCGREAITAWGGCHPADAFAVTSGGATVLVIKIPDNCWCTITCKGNASPDYEFTCHCIGGWLGGRFCLKAWPLGIKSDFGIPPAHEPKCRPTQQVVL